MKSTQTSRIHDLPPGIGAPATLGLAAAGITRLEQLTSFTEAELLKLHGVGPKAIRLLREALSERGLKFAPPADSSRVSDRANARLPRRPRKK
jgi:predicted flap endonuclease-1-like 5' DNA nuclease